MTSMTHREALALSNKMVEARWRQTRINKHVALALSALSDARMNIDTIISTASGGGESTETLQKLRSALLHIGQEVQDQRLHVNDEETFGSYCVPAGQ